MSDIQHIKMKIWTYLAKRGNEWTGMRTLMDGIGIKPCASLTFSAALNDYLKDDELDHILHGTWEASYRIRNCVCPSNAQGNARHVDSQRKRPCKTVLKSGTANVGKSTCAKGGGVRRPREEKQSSKSWKVSINLTLDG